MSLGFRCQFLRNRGNKSIGGPWVSRAIVTRRNDKGLG
jgi:hypothetical protein